VRLRREKTVFQVDPWRALVRGPSSAAMHYLLWPKPNRGAIFSSRLEIQLSLREDSAQSASIRSHCSWTRNLGTRSFSGTLIDNCDLALIQLQARNTTVANEGPGKWPNDRLRSTAPETRVVSARLPTTASFGRCTTELQPRQAAHAGSQALEADEAIRGLVEAKGT